MITIVFNVVNTILDLYFWALLLSALYSNLVAFQVIDTRNRVVWSIGDFLYRVTEPVLRPIRRVMPSFGSIDLSPLVALLLIRLVLQPLLLRVYDAFLYGDAGVLLR